MRALIDYRVNLIWWILLSFVFYTVAANVAWYYRRPRPGWIGRWIETLRGWPASNWVLEGLRLLYYLGLPYLALLRGVTNPRLMGLAGLDWIQGLGMGMALSGGAFLLLALGWWYHLRQVGALYPVASGPCPRWRQELSRPWGWALLIPPVVYWQAHWAFYRSGPILVLDDPYFGTFVGLALVILEWWTNPAWRESLGQVGRVEKTLMTTSLAFVTAIIYFFTANFWLLVLIHLALWAGLLRLITLWYGKMVPDLRDTRSSIG
ncbi:MAG: hypothetical protein ACE5NP_05660 [Anaerolineae bacterium]